MGSESFVDSCAQASRTPDVHQISRYQGAGMTLAGPLFSSGQREEQGWYRHRAVSNGGPFRRMRHAVGAPVDSHEIAIELTYRVQLTPALALQPDIQYIVNPGTEPALRNALAVGLRISWGARKDALRPVASPQG